MSVFAAAPKSGYCSTFLCLHMNWLLRTPWRSEYRAIQGWHYSSILIHLQPPLNYPHRKKGASNVIGWHTYQWSWYRSMEERPRRDSESRSATTTLLLENLHGNAANLVATTALPLPPLRSRSRIALSAQSYVEVLQYEYMKFMFQLRQLFFWISSFQHGMAGYWWLMLETGWMIKYVFLTSTFYVFWDLHIGRLT